jgi:glucose-1-phosphate adenylyltransferase
MFSLERRDGSQEKVSGLGKGSSLVSVRVSVYHRLKPRGIETVPLKRFVSRVTRDTLALVLAGGRGTRLGGLTAHRAKPAVPFAGKYRLIDFTLSNCVNSGVRRIGVLTQYKAQSLLEHLTHGWGFLRGELGEFLLPLPAQQRLGASWYRGTADAVFQNLDMVIAQNPRYVLVLGGDHIYKMDYGELIAAHVSAGARATIMVTPVSRERARDFGIIRTDDKNRVTHFCEKPDADTLKRIVGNEAPLASMGAYLFDLETLIEVLRADAEDPGSRHDFGYDILPRLLRDGILYAHPYVDENGMGRYWRDIGTLDAYWSANMEMVRVVPELNLYDTDWPIWTRAEQGPPPKFVFDEPTRRVSVVNSMVSTGSIISGATVRDSILSRRVFVDEGTLLEECLILPEARIGPYVHLRRCIVESGTDVPAHTSVTPEMPMKGSERTEQGVSLLTSATFGQPHRVLL